MSRIAAILALSPWLIGCSARPRITEPLIGLEALAAPGSEAKVQANNGKRIRLRSGPFVIAAEAALSGDVLHLRLRVSNPTHKTFRFGPEFVAVTDAGGSVLRSLSPDEAAAGVNAKAAALEQTARQEERDEASPKETAPGSPEPGGAEKTLRFLTAPIAILGIFAPSPRSEADAARADARAFQETLRREALPRGLIPPGAIAEGLAFFTAPTRWPAKLTVIVDDVTLQSQFAPFQTPTDPP
jgi:hypothetical protein